MDDRSLWLISHIHSSLDSLSYSESGSHSEDGLRPIGGYSGKNIFALSFVNPMARKSVGLSDHIGFNHIRQLHSALIGGPANLRARMPANISSIPSNNRDLTVAPHGITTTTIADRSLKKPMINDA